MIADARCGISCDTVVANEFGQKSWDEPAQAALIAQIVSGGLSLRAACERHGLSAETIRDWVPVYRQRALAALDETLHQTFASRGFGAERMSGAAYTGTLADIPLPDLLQTIQMGRKDGVISVTRGNERSTLWCEQGDVVDAESGRLRGEAAVYRILNFEHGQVFADFRLEERPRRIELPGHALLFEAARHKDESARLLEALHGAQTIYCPAAGALAVRATPAEREVLALCDGERAVHEVLEASDIADLDTLSAMASLAERGYLLREGASPLPPPSERASFVGNATPHNLVYSAIAPRRRPSRADSPLLLVSLGLLLGTLLWVGIEALRRDTSWRNMSSGDASWLGRVLAAQQERFVLETSAEPAEAQFWLDGVRMGQGPLRHELPRDGAVHRLEVHADGHLPTRVLFVDTAPVARIVLEPLPAAAR